MTATLTDAQAAQLREAAQKMSDEQFPLLRELILALLDERANPPEPPLTCPHIDKVVEMGCLPVEAVQELSDIRDINSQLRYGVWALKARSEAAEAERDALRAELDISNAAWKVCNDARNASRARAEAAEADAARLRKALEAAGDALGKLAGAEALTVPFYLKDNSEGRELNARRDYAAEQFRAARAALTTKGGGA